MLDASSTSIPGNSVRRPKLVRADSKLRNIWIVATGLLVLLLALLLWVSPTMQNSLTKLFSNTGTESVIRLLVIFYSVFAILAIIFITVGMHLAQAARKIRKYGRFPAPGMRVVHDTWVVRGYRAVFLSYFFMSIAIVLIIGGSAIPFYFHELLGQILATG